MKANGLYRVVSLLILAAVVLSAQARREIPLKNWPAPEFWQPTTAEAEAVKTDAATRAVKSDIQPTPPSSPNSLVFVAMTPCRVIDTRASQMFPSPFGAPSLSPGPPRSFPIQSSTLCTIPATAQAYSFNVTLVPTPLGANVGYLTIWPEGQAQPNAVTVDDITGDIRNNAAIVPAGTPSGGVTVNTNGNTDLVVDINGYYAPPVVVAVPQGTAAAPSISFSGDPGTGIFSSGPGLLNLSAGGNNGLTLDSTGDVNVTGGLETSRSINMIMAPIVTGDFGPTPKFNNGDPLTNCASSRHTWMTHGTFYCWDSDLMYVGMKGQTGGKTINDQTDDRKDSVIAWGDNPEADAGVGAGPDVLKFIFTGRTALGYTEDGLEVARFMPSGNFGLGTPAPTVPLDVNGQARVRVLTGTGNSLVTADASGATQGLLHSLAFPTVNPTTTFLRGDGTFAAVGGGNVSGPCSTANLIARWTGPGAIDCSHITELQTTGFPVGIGGTPVSGELDVVGGTGNVNTTNTRSSYMIGGSPVLTIFGNSNVFVGTGAGTIDTGQSNTFVGNNAGHVNTTGDGNVFLGQSAGSSNTTANGNTFLGNNAGSANTGGTNNAGALNTFTGQSAGSSNTTGKENTFNGWCAGCGNTTGNDNAYFGFQAGSNPFLNTTQNTGNQNTMLGAYTGNTSTNSSGDIYIGYNVGCPSGSPCTENSITRIGIGQSAAYVSGIFSATVSAASGVPVQVDNTGKLGTTLSSRRFKEDIQTMGDSSAGLMQLRPVTFFYKPQFDDGSHLMQYGLIAEEVAQVYPDMVVYEKDGTPLTVKYQLLAPMLLNELQKQQTVVSTQAQQIQDLQQRLLRLEALIARQ